MRKVIGGVIVCAVLLVLSASVVSAAKSGKYTYTTSGGKATISGVDTSISGEVVIPSTLGGCPVTAIGNEAFFMCSSITSITIPDTVTSIGNSAFYNCSALTKIEIPTGVKIVKESAFAECKKLKDINISESNTYISFTDGILYSGTTAIFCSDAYYATNNITEVRIKDGTDKIGAYAFAKCDSLTKVELPESVISIGDYAFEVCKNLKEIEVGENVTSIGEYAFMENFSLQNVTYKGTNEPIMGEGVFESCTALEIVSVTGDYEGDTFGDYPVTEVDSETKISISEEGAIITVENLSDVCKLIVASYLDENLVDCKITEISNGGDYKLSDMSGFIYDELNTDIIRVFLWKNMIDFEPICGSEEYTY